MATTIKLKNSVTTTNAPSSLEQGEVAINVTDKKVWVGNAATTPVQLLGTGSSATFTNLTVINDATISGLTVGKGLGSVATNTAIGASALSANTTGAYNTAINQSLRSNTSGNYNTGIGWGLNSNTSGSANIAIGLDAMAANTTGNLNVAIGVQALTSNTTASNNTAVGYQAGYSNTAGTRLTAVGYLAGYKSNDNYNTYVGSYSGYNSVANAAANTGIGDSALYANTTGASNVSVGQGALNNNTTASNNTAVGYQAGYNQTTAGGGSNEYFGYQSGYTGTTSYYNVGVGALSLFSITSGASNVAVGRGALYSNSSGNANTAVGYQAGYSVTTQGGNSFFGQGAGYSTGAAYENTFIGALAGYFNTTGLTNTYIGRGAGYNMTTGSQNTIIGSYNGNQSGLDIRTASNYIVLSDGNGNPRAYSDNAGGWTIANSLKAPTYLWAAGVGSAGGLYLGAGGSNTGLISQASTGGGTTTTYIGNQSITTSSDFRLKENIKPTERNALDLLNQWEIVDHTWNDPSDQCENNRNSRGVWTGVIAQQVQPITPWLVNKPTEEVNEDGTINPWTMDFGYAVPLLVKAIQELKAEVDSLKQQLGK